MFRKWFTRRRAAPPEDGRVRVCTSGQQLRIGGDIFLTVRGVTATGAMLHIRLPPRLHVPPVRRIG